MRLEMSEKNPPAFIAYAVGSTTGLFVWTKIGAAWKHGKGTGLNLVLNAFPPADPKTGKIKIVLRENEQGALSTDRRSEDAPAGEAGSAQSSASQQDEFSEALPHGAAPARVISLHAGGGDCPSCQGRGFVEHPTRGPVCCKACRGSKAGA